jgi:hypothetical protein
MLGRRSMTNRHSWHPDHSWFRCGIKRKIEEIAPTMRFPDGPSLWGRLAVWKDPETRIRNSRQLTGGGDHASASVVTPECVGARAQVRGHFAA